MRAMRWNTLLKRFMCMATRLKTNLWRRLVLGGLCYEDLNIPDSIFYYFNRALNIYITLQDTAGVCQTYKDIGDVYTNMKMFSNA